MNDDISLSRTNRLALSKAFLNEAVLSALRQWGLKLSRNKPSASVGAIFMVILLSGVEVRSWTIERIVAITKSGPHRPFRFSGLRVPVKDVPLLSRGPLYDCLLVHDALCHASIKRAVEHEMLNQD